MSFLLDTHTLLWIYGEPHKLSNNAKQVIENPINVLYISTVSAWEIQIKAQSGKLELAEELSAIIREQQEKNGMFILPVVLKHVYELDLLPSHHKDPFDRLLIAQARAENLTLLTRDTKFTPYDVALHW